MKLKPRAARRLLLLGVLALVVVVGGVGLIGVRKWQNERRTEKLRVDGMAAVQKQDDYGTIDNLGRYLRRKPEDREAWIKFAEARERVEEPSGQHFQQTALAYSRAWALDETDKDVGRKLLRIYNIVGQFPEARDLAIRLRPRNIAEAGPDVADILREEASARLALKAFDETLNELTERLVILQPDSYQAAFLRSSFLLSAERKDDAIQFAQARQDSRPTDPAAAFLNEMVRVNTGQQTDEIQFITAVCNAAGLVPPPQKDEGESEENYRKRLDVYMTSAPVRASAATYTEPAFAVQLVLSFDRLNMHLHSLLVLKDSATRLNDADSVRLVTRRAWQAAISPEAIALVTSVGSDPAKLHPELLGFLSLSYRDLGDQTKAREALGALKGRERSTFAQAWANLLTGLLDKPEAKDALASIDAALKQIPSEPVFLYFRAEMLNRLGRAEEARQVWSDLHKLAAAEGWAVPAVRISETFLDEGRLDDGLRAAEDAIRRSRTSAAANITKLRAQTALIESGRTPADPAAALAEIDGIRKRLAGIPQPEVAAAIDALVLPARVSLLCDLGRQPEAMQVLDGVLAKPETLSPDLARRLAAVSVRHRLDIEDRLLAATAAGAGTGDPGTLLTRALLFNSADKRADAESLIADALATAKPEEKPIVELVRAQFLDAVGDPKALETWKKLIADYPNSLPAHFGAMRSNAAAADLAFVDQVVGKLIELGGSDADRPTAEVRLARCRALLHGSPTARNRDEALTILRAMMLESPKLEARNLLIAALLMEDESQGIRPDFAAAIEQLNAASAVAINRAPYTLQLASVLERQGRTADAASELNKLATNNSADGRDRLQAVDRLANLLESESALRAVDSMIADSASEPPVDLLTRRAVLLSSLRRDREAIAAYRQSLARPIDDVDSILAIAAGLRSLGDAAGSTEAMAKLDQPSVTPFMKAVALGRLAASNGDYDVARTQFTRATELAPEDARTWSALARLSLQRGELDAAESAAKAGLAKLPGNAELSVILQQALLARQTDTAADLTGLADALDKIPGMERRASAIRAIEQTKKAGKLDDVAGLARLGDEFADDPTTQLFVARRLSSFNPPRNQEAATLLRRAANRFPADPGIQEQATRTLASLNDWAPALVTATAWRALTRSPESDLAVAEAQLALKRARPALDAIAAYKLPAPPSIAETDTLSLGVLNVRMRAQCALGDPKAAFALVQPYLSTPFVRRALALPTAVEVVEPLDEAKRWSEQIAAASTADDVDEQLVLAGAWARLADRFPAARADLLARGLAVTTPLASSESTADARVFGTRAALLSAAGDHKAAIEAGRQALAKDPKSLSSLLGLAGLLIDHGDPAEAATLARQAAEAHPSEAGPYMVIAAAHLKQAEGKAASGDSAGRDAARGQALDAIKIFNGLNIAGCAARSEMAGLAEQTENYPVIIALYDRALAAPDAPGGLQVAILKNNLAYAIYMNSGEGASKTDLPRAKRLIDEAIQTQQLAPFYDTLGSIDEAMGDRAGAIAAYRKALSLDAKSIGSAVGLAHLLVSGTAEEKTEVGALIKTIDAALAAGETLSDSRKKQLTEARSKLGGG